jgi:diaminopimelate epimerase
MILEFYKYEGAGNDFILLDDRTGIFPSIHYDLVKRLCDRRFGIGADGLMLLRSCPGYDFNMVYYNSDGREGTMCGNGGRCIAAFAEKLGIVQKRARFMAIDGEHLATLMAEHYVRLKMSDVQGIESGKGYYYLNTGSPHYVTFVTGLAGLDVFTAGRDIRFNNRFREEGTNVNFVEEVGDHLFVRTYERGVENETLACGTGVVAAVISAYLKRKSDKIAWSMPVKVMGGQLQVSFTVQDDRFTDIWLEGPATYVFQGKITL